jgi:mannose-6-phosphate isomerase-like protein (cupin superfamily)
LQPANCQAGAHSDGPRQHEGDEVGYIVTGEIVLAVEGDTCSPKAGDAFFFPSMHPHAVANPGEGLT